MLHNTFLTFIFYISTDHITNEAIKTLINVGFYVVLIYAVCVFGFVVVRTTVTEYDELGIHIFQINGNEVFCAWDSITRIENRYLGRIGRVFLIYSNEYFVIPRFLALDHRRLKKGDSDVLMVWSGDKSFKDHLKKYRSNINIEFFCKDQRY